MVAGWHLVEQLEHRLVAESQNAVTLLHGAGSYPHLAVGADVAIGASTSRQKTSSARTGPIVLALRTGTI